MPPCAHRPYHSNIFCVHNAETYIGIQNCKIGKLNIFHVACSGYAKYYYMRGDNDFLNYGLVRMPLYLQFKRIDFVAF